MKLAAWISAAVLADIIVGAVTFAHFEHLSFATALYFAIVTAFTVGYGDVVPHAGPGKITAVILMSTTIPAMAVVFGRLTALHSARAWHRQHGRRLEQQLAKAHRIAADTHKAVTGEDHPDAPD